MYESSGSQFFKTTTGIQSGPNKFLEKFSVNNFALSDAEDHTFGPLNRGGIADLTFVENTISNLPKVPRAKFLGSNGPF